MTRYLFTPTLYNSWRYYLTALPDKEPQKRAEFISTLKREPFQPTEAILKGFAFEDDVKAQSEGKLQSKSLVVQQLGEIVKGGLWQQALSAKVNIAGRDVLLYGKADVIKGDTIFDLKRSSSYEEGKYRESLQHLIYMFCANLPNFRYLVGYGTGKEAKDWAAEDYYLLPDTENKIQEKAAEMFFWLKTSGLMPLYEENWKCKY